MAETEMLFSEEYQLLDTVYALAVAAGAETNSGYVDTSTMGHIVIVIHPMDVNDVIDVDIEQATSAAGAGAKSLSASEFDATIATTDTKPTVIEIPGEAFDVDGGFRYINVELTAANTAGGGNDFCVEVWGRPYYMPADTTNLDSVIHT